MRTLPFVSLATLIGLAGALPAAPQVDADHNRDYPVTPEAGKWMICAASYTGPESPELARQLAYQIRARDHVPAYTYSRSNELRRQQQEEQDRLKAAYPNLPSRRPRVRIEEQWAVLIGGWPDFDSASAELPRIKKLQMHELKTTSGRIPNDVLVVPAGNDEEERKKGKLQAVILNPVINSFVIRNPTVPPDVKPVARFDPLWEKLNANEPYSLLKNPKQWTLVVKEYRGVNVLQSSATQSSGFLDTLLGKKPGEALGAAGAQASEVARLLRQFKFEAWVMHTRTSSYVTVGGFDSKDDPNLQNLAGQFSRMKLGPLDFMAQPMPAVVPRLEK
jgi:hypothetical protein